MNKDVPLQKCLSERGTLILPAGPAATASQITELEGAFGTKLPATLSSLLRAGGLWSFNRFPQQEIRTFSPTDILHLRPKLQGWLDLPPSEPRVIDAPVDQMELRHVRRPPGTAP